MSGEISGPALGILASCPSRIGYPNAIFTLAEPRLEMGGTVTAITARQQQLTRMLDTLYFRLSEVTGREVDEIREDARRRRSLTTARPSATASSRPRRHRRAPVRARPRRPGNSPAPFAQISHEIPKNSPLYTLALNG